MGERPPPQPPEPKTPTDRTRQLLLQLEATRGFGAPTVTAAAAASPPPPMTTTTMQLPPPPAAAPVSVPPAPLQAHADDIPGSWSRNLGRLKGLATGLLAGAGPPEHQWTVLEDRLKTPGKRVEKTKTLRNLVRRNAVPGRMRGRLWMEVTGAFGRLQENKGLYYHLVNKYRTAESATTQQIEKDVARTMIGGEKFQTDDGRDTLRRLLATYARFNSKIGYCQAMHVLAAFLLMRMKEEEAFWLLATVIERVLPPDYYSESMRGVMVDISTFNAIAHSVAPRIMQHLDQLGVSMDMFLTQWFLSLFVGVMPEESASRVLDVLFFEGSHVLFRVVLGLLKIFEKDILATTDAQAAMLIIRDMPTEVPETTLLEYVFSVQMAHREKIEAMRESFRSQLASAEASGSAPSCSSDPASATQFTESDGVLSLENEMLVDEAEAAARRMQRAEAGSPAPRSVYSEPTSGAEPISQARSSPSSPIWRKQRSDPDVGSSSSSPSPLRLARSQQQQQQPPRPPPPRKPQPPVPPPKRQPSSPSLPLAAAAAAEAAVAPQEAPPSKHPHGPPAPSVPALVRSASSEVPRRAQQQQQQHHVPPQRPMLTRAMPTLPVQRATRPIAQSLDTADVESPVGVSSNSPSPSFSGPRKPLPLPPAPPPP